MKQTLKRWWPIALCCLPGIALAVAVGVGLSTGGISLGWGVRALAILACPIAMGVMMWWMSRDMSHPSNQIIPGAAAERLAALRAEQQALEAEITATERLAALETQRTAPLSAPVILDNDAAPAANR